MRINRSAALGWLSLLLWGGAHAQSPAKTPQFEVADIRVNKSGDPQTGEFLPSGLVTLRGVTVKTLIGIAWKESRVLPELSSMSVGLAPTVSQFNNVLGEYLKGGPPWIDSDRFDVLAKAPAGTPNDTLRLMMQNLLQDRFHVSVHKEEKLMKVYAMTVAKGGHKLTPGQVSTDPVCGRRIGEDNVYHRDCKDMSMQQLAEQLATFAPRFFEGRPVVDATELKGGWSFTVDWTPLSGGLAGIGAPSDQEFDTGTTIFKTMEKNLGLKLDKRDLPMPIVVIDKVDRVPTDN
jgi:uncharacterized protein (TIGR03435 family)